MREAFGGTFMIKLMLIFLAVYVAFIAVALNYAKAFRVKNKIIDIIEQSEGIDDFTDTSGVIGEINSYLKSVSYYVSLDKGETSVDKNTGGCFTNGYCIYKTSNSVNSEYYGVSTYIRIELPFFGINIPIEIKGETRKIERINR